MNSNKEILEETLQKYDITAPSVITALLVNHYLGGEIARTELTVDGKVSPYYFNIIEDKKIDFNKHLSEYVGESYCVSRNQILSNHTIAEQYKQLERRVDLLIPFTWF